MQALDAAAWQRLSAGEGTKGPRLYDWAWLAHESEAAGGWQKGLLIRRKLAQPEAFTFYLTLAPEAAGLADLVRVAGTRWTIEASFEAAKGEVGLDQYEGRRYRGLKRHMILSCISYLFLSRMRQEFGGEKPGADGVPGAHGGGGADPVLVVEPEPAEEVAGADLGGDRANAAAQRPGATVPHQANASSAACSGHQAHRSASLPMGTNLAL